MKHCRVAVLMTCFNRVDKTIACLRYLFDATVPEGVTLKVFLVDDGSTDGTADRVLSLYPDVNVIMGTGSLFWAGGMRLAWAEAEKDGADYYLWLNDDTFLYRESLSLLFSDSKLLGNKGIVCGALASESSGDITYGGRLIGESSCLVPDGSLQKCHLINGNCVLVPKEVFEKVGSLDKWFRHAIADLDYGLRANRIGFPSYVASNVVGTCESNLCLPKWCLKDVPFFQRLRILYSPLGYAEPIPYLVYVRRHFGIVSALRQFASIHARVAFPQLWKI